MAGMLRRRLLRTRPIPGLRRADAPSLSGSLITISSRAPGRGRRPPAVRLKSGYDAVPLWNNRRGDAGRVFQVTSASPVPSSGTGSRLCDRRFRHLTKSAGRKPSVAGRLSAKAGIGNTAMGHDRNVPEVAVLIRARLRFRSFPR